MKVTMLLCDAAQVADGKLYVLGGGWSVLSQPAVPTAIALKIDVDWNEAEIPHHWELFLIDADGRQVMVDTPEGAKPIEVRGDFQVGKPTAVPEGSPIDMALAINMGPMPLGHGNRYTWRFVVDGMTDQDWSVSFYVRPVPEA